MQITCQGSPHPPFYREEAELRRRKGVCLKSLSKMGAGIGESAQAWGPVPFPQPCSVVGGKSGLDSAEVVLVPPRTFSLRGTPHVLSSP